MGAITRRVFESLSAAVDSDSVLCARRAFFALASFATLRFMAKGWIDDFYVTPSYHFTWPLLHFVQPLSRGGMYLLFIAMALSAACAAVGLAFRLSAWIFTIGFLYVEVLDRTYYLNHYYLITLVAALFALSPSVTMDAKQMGTISRWVPLLLRFQIALVYIYAGLAKLDGDFLLRGEPLHTWLLHYAHLPHLGPFLARPITAVLMSWTGTLFDLLVVPALLLTKTRPFAYAALVIFHLSTFVLLDIGVFPWFMIALTTLFFPYNWPKQLLRPRATKAAARIQRANATLRPTTATLLSLYVLLQLLLPLRHLVYPGPVNWTEEGFRFAWRVMLFEKTGRVEYRLQNAVAAKVNRISPRDELTQLQTNMLSTQPDMIRQYASHLAERARNAREHGVRVYADTAISLNGRHAVEVLDPNCDLTTPLSPFSHDPCILQRPERTY